MRIGIVVSEFNKQITLRMLKGAEETLHENRVAQEQIDVVWVPGGFEIPLACLRLAEKGTYQALIALGCIVKGETSHDLYLATAATQGIMDVMLRYKIPIGFGVLTTNNLAQAEERASGGNNKGKEAAEAALTMVLDHK